MPKSVNPDGVEGYVQAAAHHLGDAAEDDEHAERDDKRREFLCVDQDAVEHTDTGAEQRAA